MFTLFFKDKLVELNSNITKVKDAIIQAANDVNIKELQNLTEKLKEYNLLRSEYVKDILHYLTVAEVIEFYNLKEKYGDRHLNLLTQKEVVFHFRHYSKGVTMEEREDLTKVFGWEMKQIKIK